MGAAVRLERVDVAVEPCYGPRLDRHAAAHDRRIVLGRENAPVVLPRIMEKRVSRGRMVHRDQPAVFLLHPHPPKPLSDWNRSLRLQHMAELPEVLPVLRLGIDHLLVQSASFLDLHFRVSGKTFLAELREKHSRIDQVEGRMLVTHAIRRRVQDFQRTGIVFLKELEKTGQLVIDLVVLFVRHLFHRIHARVERIGRDENAPAVDVGFRCLRSVGMATADGIQQEEIPFPHPAEREVRLPHGSRNLR